MPHRVTTLPTPSENTRTLHNYTLLYRLGDDIENPTILAATTEMSHWITHMLERDYVTLLEEDILAKADELGAPAPIIIGVHHALPGEKPTPKSRPKPKHSTDEPPLTTLLKPRGRLVGITTTLDSEGKPHRYLYIRDNNKDRQVIAYGVRLPRDPRPDTYVAHNYSVGAYGSQRHFMPHPKG